MIGKKMPSTVCETVNGSGEQLSMSEVLLSADNSITAWMPAQGISALLLPGGENAIPLHHLMRVTGCDARTIRQLIHRERLAGIPILADMRSGFFLASSEAERACWVRSMLHRAEEITRAARAVERGGGPGE